MSLEIERKWIVDQDLPTDWEVLLEEKVWTAYLNDNPELRARKRGNRETVISIKWPIDTSGLIREEIETSITDDDFARMTDGRALLMREDRHLKLPSGHVLEYSYIPDLGRAYGEIEFTSEEGARTFEPPFAWGREVTGRVEHSFRAVYDEWQRGAFSGLYYSEPEILASDVEVIEVQGNRVKIDPQIFYPEGGGQPGDRGRLGTWGVVDTNLLDGEIWLELDEPAEVISGAILPASIDKLRRDRFRQQHTAEHLLSGLAHKYLGVKNTGFHMNDAFITLDFNRRLESEEIARLEELANEGIRANARVKAHNGTVESFADIPYRAKMEFSGPLRLIEIEGYDLCACSSLHVKQTGELGIIQILQEKAVRGGSRLTVLVGREALDELQARAQISEALAREKSCHYTDLVDRLHKDEAEIQALKQKILSLSQLYLAHSLADTSELQNPLVVFISGEEDEVMLVHDYLLQEPDPSPFLLLRPLSENTYSFKLFGPEIDTQYESLRTHFQVLGGIRDSLAQGRLIAKEDLSEILSRLGYKTQRKISFH